jgi:hypothetical protein
MAAAVPSAAAATLPRVAAAIPSNAMGTGKTVLSAVVLNKLSKNTVSAA